MLLLQFHCFQLQHMARVIHGFSNSVYLIVLWDQIVFNSLSLLLEGYMKGTFIYVFDYVKLRVLFLYKCNYYK